MVAGAVQKAIPEIAMAVEAAYEAIRQGGHLIYVGAGTSGRLGILDASECVPTYGVEPDLVQGYIAGGDRALRTPVEGCEDSKEQGEQLIVDNHITDKDVVVGISASGTASFVRAALQKAKEIGAVTVAITNNHSSPLKEAADICIEAVTGAEAVSGSTRMKAGTAQKLVLNMLSTCAMVKTGKVYENLMVNLKPSNEKLKGRVIRITAAILDCTEEEAIPLLEKNDWNIRKTVEGAK